ncbi:protogenin A [Tachysurus ichikawai]
MYQMGSTLLRYSIESPGSPSLQQPFSLHTLLGPSGGDSEGSHSSEGSHETGDSGRYSHDEHDLANLSSGSPGGSPDHVTEERMLHLAIEMQEVTSPSSTSQDS